MHAGVNTHHAPPSSVGSASRGNSDQRRNTSSSASRESASIALRLRVAGAVELPPAQNTPTPCAESRPLASASDLRRVSFIRPRSAVVSPGRAGCRDYAPLAESICDSVSAEQPISRRTRDRRPRRFGASRPRRPCTIRTARSRTSPENLFVSPSLHFLTFWSGLTPRASGEPGAIQSELRYVG